MPLQNRVDPLGRIFANKSRGLFTGNCGIIHDPATRTLLKRRWTTRAWIICVCDYKDRSPRDVMGYQRGDRPGWTELFFLDEATALAAGHRPCFFCRREPAKRYAGHFADVFGISDPKVAEMDARLHAERLASGGRAVSIEKDALGDLPDGAMIRDGEGCRAILKGHALPWSFAGYGEPVPFARLAGMAFQLVTPATTTAILKAGYRPVWHSSATA